MKQHTRLFHCIQRISESEKEWVPYVIVFGEKELKSKELAIRVRSSGKIEKMSKEELIKKLIKEQNNMPWKQLPLPVLLSKRPIFFG